MSISPRLDLRQTQTLVMTPQLQQAIKLLQMSNQELGEFVASEIEQNPLLERPDDPDGEALPAEHVPAGEEYFAAGPAKTREARSERRKSKRNRRPEAPAGEDEMWANDGYAGEDRYAHTHNGSFDGDEFRRAENVAEGPSLREHL